MKGAINMRLIAKLSRVNMHEYAVCDALRC